MTPESEPGTEYLPDEAALAHVSALLAGLPRPAIPAGVAARIAEAIASEAAAPPARQRRRPYLALAAAALVILAGGIGLTNLHRTAPTSTAASAADLASVANALEPDLHRLQTSIPAPVADNTTSLGYGAAGSAPSTPAPSPVNSAPNAAQATAGMTPAELADCIAAVGRSGQTASLVESVKLGSDPAIALAFISQDGTSADVLIVAPTCRPGSPQLLGRTTVLLPTG